MVHRLVALSPRCLVASSPRCVVCEHRTSDMAPRRLDVLLPADSVPAIWRLVASSPCRLDVLLPANNVQCHELTPPSRRTKSHFPIQ